MLDMIKKLFCRSFYSQCRIGYQLIIALVLATPNILSLSVNAADAVERNDNLSLKSPAALFPAVELPISTWVGPGDVLRIRSFPDTGSYISGDYTILDSGCVVLPILGLIQVTHKSIEELTKQLSDSYAKFLSFPSLLVEPLITMSFIGGFLKPGIHLVNPLNPFSYALSTAGGTVRDDGLKQLRWERDGKVVKKNLTFEVQGAHSLWNLGFKSGDQICITQQTKRDMLLVTNFIVTTVLTTASIILTFQVLNK
jgi:protein involved in polysaccharide export with SLBB domain